MTKITVRTRAFYCTFKETYFAVRFLSIPNVEHRRKKRAEYEHEPRYATPSSNMDLPVDIALMRDRTPAARISLGNSYISVYQGPQGYAKLLARYMHVTRAHLVTSYARGVGSHRAPPLCPGILCFLYLSYRLQFVLANAVNGHKLSLED